MIGSPCSYLLISKLFKMKTFLLSAVALLLTLTSFGQKDKTIVTPPFKIAVGTSPLSLSVKEKMKASVVKNPAATAHNFFQIEKMESCPYCVATVMVNRNGSKQAEKIIACTMTRNAATTASSHCPLCQASLHKRS
jgi:hypothetical protein